MLTRQDNLPHEKGELLRPEQNIEVDVERLMLTRQDLPLCRWLLVGIK